LLTGLIKEAENNNLELKRAQARVRRARALRGIRRATLFPAVDAAGAVEAGRDSEARGGNGSVDRLYAAGFDAGWEIDVFGGRRRAVEAAEADLQAIRADLRDVLVSLVAEVALNYVDVRTYQARLVVARANLASQEKTYGIIRSRHAAGLDSKLVLEQARYNLEGTRSQIPVLESGLTAAMNRLAVLLGHAPGWAEARLAASKPVPVPPPSVAIGVPAEALRRRPDIRGAERRLAAQSARVGVAVADLYPKFRLDGSIGLEAAHAGDFVKSGSFFWGLMPSVSWNVFDAGAIRRNIEAQSATQEEALLAYEAAVLGALEEVENALTNYAKEQQRRQSLREAVSAAKEAEGLSQDLYLAGLTSFESVLDAQRFLLTFQDQLAVSEGAVTSRLISLYKALGGGWSPMEPEPDQ
jgi:NodT family efflux transporter outer membrane factor (OMF) lipoprotein